MLALVEAVSAIESMQSILNDAGWLDCDNRKLILHSCRKLGRLNGN